MTPVTGWLAETIAIALLVGCLVAAVVRPRNISEALVAVPASGLVVLTGIVPVHVAGQIINNLTSTVAFLAAILVFGHLCADAGVFTYLGAVAARASRGQPRRLLLMFVIVASLVTATLTLDAAVVLLTPVVVRTTLALRVPSRPHTYACVELANAGSLLLPVSNLTNLLAFAAADVSFARFTALMTLPWLAATALQWLGLRRFFAADLTGTPVDAPPPPPRPNYALVILAVTVSGFVITSAVGIPPAWAALGGVLLLGGPALRGHGTTPFELFRSANLGFCAFVFALGIVVEAVSRHGLGHGLGHLVPGGSSLPTLLALAFLAAALANLVNNLPATLVLLPLVTGHPAAVLAVLIGVNIGPNASFAGSLATLLWRRLLPAKEPARARDFHLYGLLTVAPSIAVTTVLLWLGVQVIGA